MGEGKNRQIVRRKKKTFAGLSSLDFLEMSPSSQLISFLDFVRYSPMPRCQQKPFDLSFGTFLHSVMLLLQDLWFRMLLLLFCLPTVYIFPALAVCVCGFLLLPLVFGR